MSFFSRISDRSKEIDSLLCVGLDPHLAELNVASDADEETVAAAALQFCKSIIEATYPYAVSYKPNSAFFESLGGPGHATLTSVISSIPNSIPVLLDCKRGDIGSTASAYAQASYVKSGADGVTLSPLMGYDSVEPFVTGEFAGKGGAFLLCKTSNPGSEDILKGVAGKIARLAGEWSERANGEKGGVPCLGLVVGATDAAALRQARMEAKGLWILSPGVGAQGGDLDAALMAGLDEEGSGMLVPVSRGISRAEDRAEAAKKLRDDINDARKRVVEGKSKKEDGIETFQTEFIEFALQQGVLKFGSFTLKSGRESPYFFNAGLFDSGAALFKLGKAYAASIMSSELALTSSSVKFDVIFGPAYKGISLGAIVAAALYADFGVDVGFAYNRKEAKDHGEGGMLVGASMKGKKVLVVDDVISAGTAIRESHSMLTKIEAIPVGVSIALDRAEKRALDDPVSAVQAVARDLAIPVVSIVGLKQLFGFLSGSGDFDASILEAVTKYRSEYGVD
ncbi:hypothetical protein TrVE_jg12652 [Triparma verrucosa]|uniref:Orotidine 5'-phosphate decarboxylase n=1 Tax=Triparma verrucosa TaxID=1606542 RepID=A0A9W7FBN6_9STRA|nr:hypothetical protein TrVE_jg12652 [Triparma verrucosa]